MKSKLIIAMLVVGTVSNLAMAVNLPALDITKINTLGCTSRNFSKGNFIIENLQTPDKAIIKFEDGMRRELYDVKIINKMQVNFSFDTTRMVLEFSSTSWEDDTNYNAYAVYSGILYNVINASDEYAVSTVQCSNID